MLGCGAVGLATARLLQERGCRVTIYTKALPPNTTSNIAGAQWCPVSVYHHGQEPPGFLPRFVEASHIANRRYQLMVGARYGIRWMPNYVMGRDSIPPGALLAFDSPIRDLLPEMHDLAPSENPFPYPWVRQFDTMMIEPNTYLPAVMQDSGLPVARSRCARFANMAELQTPPAGRHRELHGPRRESALRR